MYKKQLLAMTASLGMMAVSSSAFSEFLHITENFNPSTGKGSYTITMDQVGFEWELYGLIVSNTDSTAYIANTDPTVHIETYTEDFGCGPGYCYDAVTVNQSNWDSTIAFSDVVEEQDGQVDIVDFFLPEVFGDFADHVEPGENTIHYYRGADGNISNFTRDDNGNTVKNFFLFEAPAANSMATALILNYDTGLLSAESIPVVTAVPLPAAGWLMASSLFGMGLFTRRRRQS